jgi:hypothetical protein
MPVLTFQKLTRTDCCRVLERMVAGLARYGLEVYKVTRSFRYSIWTGFQEASGLKRSIFIDSLRLTGSSSFWYATRHPGSSRKSLLRSLCTRPGAAARARFFSRAGAAKSEANCRSCGYSPVRTMVSPSGPTISSRASTSTFSAAVTSASATFCCPIWDIFRWDHCGPFQEATCRGASIWLLFFSL